MAKMTVAASHCGTRRRQRAFPEKEQTEHHQRNVDENVGQQQDVQNAARILAKHLDELLEGRMLFLEPAELMRLEGKERGLKSGKKRGTKNQKRDDQQEKREAERRHPSPRPRLRHRVPSEEPKRARLPIISAALKLSS